MFTSIPIFVFYLKKKNKKQIQNRFIQYSWILSSEWEYKEGREENQYRVLFPHNHFLNVKVPIEL